MIGNGQKLFVILLLIIGLGLSLFQLRFWIEGPQMEIESQHIFSTTGKVELVFKVLNTKVITINGQKVIPSIDGVVRHEAYVARGHNVLAIDLYDGFSGKTREYIHITYPQEGK